jgi:hypothetical protein
MGPSPSSRTMQNLRATRKRLHQQGVMRGLDPRIQTLASPGNHACGHGSKGKLAFEAW